MALVDVCVLVSPLLVSAIPIKNFMADSSSMNAFVSFRGAFILRMTSKQLLENPVAIMATLDTFMFTKKLEQYHTLDSSLVSDLIMFTFAIRAPGVAFSMLMTLIKMHEGLV